MRNAQKVDLAFAEMWERHKEHIELKTGLLNTTALAEDVCEALDMWHGDLVPVALFEIAFAISEMIERGKPREYALKYSHSYGDYADAWDREGW